MPSQVITREPGRKDVGVALHVNSADDSPDVVEVSLPNEAGYSERDVDESNAIGAPPVSTPIGGRISHNAMRFEKAHNPEKSKR